MSTPIVSHQNKLIKLVRKLLNDKKYRDQTNLFVAESYRVVKSLINNKVECQNLIIAHDARYLNEFKKLLDPQKIILVSNDIIHSLTTLVTPEGVIGVFKKNLQPLKIKPQNGKYLILHQVQNPVNLGAILRTAVAFGLDGVFITNASVDVFHPLVLRTSMGTSALVGIQVSTSLSDVINKLHHLHYTCYATAITSNATSLEKITFDNNSAILFGNEANGLKSQELKLCDQTVSINIDRNKIDSLNIAAAVAIIIHWLKVSCK
jgi:TrmH family RNA methyltransferase